MASDSDPCYSQKKMPHAYFGSEVLGRFREVSINPLTNRAYFVNDVSSRIYVCDLTQGNLLFTISKRISYPVDAYAKGQVLIVSNYNSNSVSFHTLEGDLISVYPLGKSILGLTMDCRGGLNVCACDAHCIVEIDDDEVTERGGGWLKFPSKLASDGELLYVLDSGEGCCRVMREGKPLRNVIRYSSKLVSIPIGISVDVRGNIVLVFAPDGKFLHEIKYVGKHGVGTLKSVGGIDLDSKGDIVVTCPLTNGNLAFSI